MCSSWINRQWKNAALKRILSLPAFSWMFRGILLLLISSLSGINSLAAIPPAGTVITNKASATFANQPWPVESGTVSVVVQAIIDEIEIIKSASTLTPRQSDIVTFSLNSRNRGNSRADSMPVVIDGVVTNYAIIRDYIPLNCTFHSSVSSSTSRRLYHLLNDPFHAYVTTLPANLEEVDAVAFGVSDLPMLQTVDVEFKVRINRNASGLITNTAYFYMADDPGTIQAASDGPRIQERIVASNPVVLTLPFLSAELAYYVDGNFDRIARSATIGDPLFLAGAASGCNTNSLVIETKQIQIQSTLTGDVEVFTATETSANSGVFRVLDPIPTRLGDINPVISGNGILETVQNDILTATMDDCASANLNATIQMETPATSGFFIEKAASRTTAEIGDSVVYRIKIKNNTGRALPSVKLVDNLPAGFSYLEGTARVDDKEIEDPQGGKGPRLKFSIGNIPDGSMRELQYRVRIGPGALQGNGINSAQAFSVGPPKANSNVATAKVELREGVFTSRGIVFGKIFIDRNLNNIQDAGEPGVPGVRLYLEDGTYAITDGEGKYSIYGLRPITHVIKADYITLPESSNLLPISTRHALDGNSRFVDLKGGEFHKADFAIAPSPRVEQEVKARIKAAREGTREIFRSVQEPLSRDEPVLYASDPKSLSASGVVKGTVDTSVKNPPTNAVSSTTQPAQRFNAVLPRETLNSANSSLPSPAPMLVPQAAKTDASVDASLAGISNNVVEFLNLKDGDTLPIPQTNVRVKGPAGSVFVLKVNGREIAPRHMARKITDSQRNLELGEYVGVDLTPGRNQLEIIQKDPFGNVRGSSSIYVIAPDKLSQIKISLPKREQPANGTTPAVIGVSLVDGNGVPVTARTRLTLEASLGAWLVEDLDRREPGVQVFIEGGYAEYSLLAPIEPGDSLIVVSSGVMEADATLPFLPDLRPMFVNGLVEGVINLKRMDRGILEPARSQDGFEEELREFAVSGNNGKATGAARAAFFLKGKVLGKYLLTAAYDSDKASRERMFRDIQPDEFYPVYGDSSVKGYDAQSTGRLYVRVDHKKSYLLYGDFTTQAASEVRGLGNYSRSLTGVKEHYENDRVSANVWASQDSTRQVIEELPANGTSGPYRFNTARGIVNSEKVEILTRDRRQPSIILKSEVQTRFEDYEFEPFSGRLLFKFPVPSLDENLNPIFIRVTYEVDQGGESFWVYGADAQVKVTDRFELGGVAVRDENPLAPFELYSANSTVKLGEKTFLFGEMAQTQSGDVTGDAGRIELRHQDENTDARIFYARSDNTFTNASSVLGSGRVEAGVKVTRRLDEKTRVIAQGTWSEDEASTVKEKEARVDVERAIGKYKVEVGVRHAEQTREPGAFTPFVEDTPDDVNSIRTKVTSPVPYLDNASIYGEYENDIVDTRRRMFAIGGEYRVDPKTRLYARHELIDDLDGPFELNASSRNNTTLVGVESEYMKDGHFFNEYRARDAISGRESEAAIGLRNVWTLDEGLRLSTTFERVTPFQSHGEEQSTAATGAIEYTANPDWKGTARLELRTSENEDSVLNTLGYARRVDEDWTLLSKTILYHVDNKTPDSEDSTQGRFQIGMAYRQSEINRWNGLAKYEYKYEDGPGFGSGFDEAGLERQVHIWSMDVNYQPKSDWIFSGHYAGKFVFESDVDYDGSYHAHLVGGRILHDLNKRWDVALNMNTLFSENFESVQYSVGPEIGYLLGKNLRIGLGYNFAGFYDRDLTASRYTNPGVFINMRLKFDEHIFDGFGRREEE